MTISLLDTFHRLTNKLIRLNFSYAREAELRVLTKSVKRMMTSQKRLVRGVSDLVFTVGEVETNAFIEENESRRQLGESTFVPVKNGNIASKEKKVVMWKRISSTKDEFLTDIVLSSTQPNHEHSFIGDKEGYSVYIHPEMRGLGAADPTLCLWFKKDTNKSRFIADVRVSYTKDDHIDFLRLNYEMLPLCLSHFNLGYANIWILWSSSSMVRITDTTHIERELKDYNAMLIKNPDDAILSQMADKIKYRLREAQLAEEDHARDIPSDDLTYTKEFLALTSKELDTMKSIFHKSIDLDHDDRISVDDFCIFLRETMALSPFIRQVFELSAPTNGKLSKYLVKTNAPILDIGATLKATAVFCMLSTTELMKFVFSWYDPKGYGVIDNKQFLSMLGQFHPRHRDDIVVQALKKTNLPVDGMVSFSKFETVCIQFPFLFYPAFRIQDKVSVKIICVPYFHLDSAIDNNCIVHLQTTFISHFR